MAKVAIVGVGAIGGALAGLLETPADTRSTCARGGPLPQLTVKTLEREFEVHARNVTDPAQAEPVDWVLVATKTYDAAGAAALVPCPLRQAARRLLSCRTAWSIASASHRM